MDQKEQDDIQALINLFFPFAEELLIKYGEFHPYAGATTHGGEFVSASRPDPNEQATPEKTVERIKAELKASFILYKLIAVFYEVRTRDAVTGDVSDAIAVFVEHADGQSAYEFFYPYSMKDQDHFMVHDMYGNAVRKEIFPEDKTPV